MRNIRHLFGFGAGVGLALWGTVAAAGGLFNNWALSMKISFTGYTRTETLTNFPVLVTFTEGSNGFHYADFASPADGADLRFSSADGLTELPYELETWNTAGVSVVWVQVDRLSAGTNIIAYWGKDGEPVMAYTTNGAVWSQGFGGVWHLDEAVANGGLVNDSTSNRNNGVFADADGDSITAVAAAVGKGIHLTGDADCATVPHSASISPTNALTMEAWMLSDGVNWNSSYTALSKELSYLFGGNGSTKNYVAYFRDASTWRSAQMTTLASVTNWHHYVGTYDRVRLRLYIDGAEVVNNAFSTAIVTNGNPLVIGGRPGSSAYLDGWLDEARISSVGRSSNWVWACWLNQASNQVFASSDSPLPGALPEVYNIGAVNLRDHSADLVGQLASTGLTATTVWLYWDTSDRATNKTWAGSTNWTAGALGAITNTLNGLLPNQAYFYTYYASNAVGGTWAQPSQPFETAGQPSIDNGGGATGLGYMRATLRGTLLDGLSATGTVFWGEAPDSLTNSIGAGWVTEGSFSVTLTSGLQDDTPYFYRCFVSNEYGTAWAPDTAAFTSPPMSILTWTGAGATNLASNPTNWAGGVCPVTGDVVHFDGTSSKDVLWNLSIALRAWDQDAGYTGTVTFATVRPGRGPFTNLVISTDCAINGGAWTHLLNTGGAVENEWLSVTIGGNLTVGPGGAITADAKGYTSGNGPGVGGATNSRGATHAGIGGHGSSTPPNMTTYGSIVFPTNHGSAATFSTAIGGGTIQLRVAGTTRLDGPCSAKGAVSGAAGGSISLITGALTGTNALNVSGVAGGNNGGGGGGRLSVILTNATDFASVQMIANGGGNGQNGSAAAGGTIYTQTKDQSTGHGVLIINGGGAALQRQGICTLMPTSGTWNAAVNLDDFAAIILTNKGYLGVNTDTTMSDFSPAHLVGGGTGESYLAFRGTNAVTFPATLSVSNYTFMADIPLRFSQNVVVENSGAISHSRNQTEQFKANLTIPGNLTIRPGGAVSVDERGFASPYMTAGGASYGGRGYAVTNSDTFTYGSVLTPTNLGTHASSVLFGGGAVQMDVAGTTTVDGVISARALPPGSAGGSGGSIWLKTGYLTGAGTITANGGTGSSYAGGGGRISVVLTQSETFGGVNIQAFGGTDAVTAPYLDGAAGTIYKEGASQAGGRGDLILYGLVHSRTSNWYRTHTDLPASTNATADELSYVTLRALTNCTVGLTADVTMQDLFLMRDDTVLYLNGHTLTLRSRYHSDWGTAARVVYDGGSIVWKPAGTLILIR